MISSARFPAWQRPICDEDLPTKVTLPHHLLALRDKINMWCVDDSMTAHATYDRRMCVGIRPCHIEVHRPDSTLAFVCKEVGHAMIGSKSKSVTLVVVLIHEDFPCHIFAEALTRGRPCTTESKPDVWSLHSPKGDLLLLATQRLRIRG